MKKLNKKYIQIGVITLLVICLSLLFNHFLNNLSLTDSTRVNLGKIMLPIIDGCALAYFLNPLMKIIENKLLFPLCGRIKTKKPVGKKTVRGLSIALTMIIFLLIVAGLILLIVPQLLDSI